MDAVRTVGLRKCYGSREVLHGIDLTVAAGSLYGFLGPNGAGKTTTLRILMGLLRASGGEAHVLGKDPWRSGPQIRAQTGYLSGDVRLYDALTGRQTVDFVQRARRRDCLAESSRLARAFDLNLDRRVRQFSRGMKQKLALILSLMHQPRLLILDEPSIALDPLVREVLHAELRHATRAGRTVLFSSHTLSEVEQLCDHVAILSDGRVIEQTRIGILKRRAVRHVEIHFADGAAVPTAFPVGLRVARTVGQTLYGSWTGPAQELVGWLAGQSISDVSISAPDLEDLFLAYYSDRVAEGAK